MAQPQRKEQERQSKPRGGGRGRHAHSPRHIPKKGWRDVLLRVKDEYTEDNLTMVAAGVAFYGFLAFVPALAAIVSLYGLWASPDIVQQQIQSLSAILPPAALTLLEDQLTRLSQTATSSLTFGLVGSVLLSLWSANKGMKALVSAMNIAYDESEERGFFRLNGVTLLLTLGAVVTVLVALTLVAVLPAMFATFGLGDTAETLIAIARWPVLAVGMAAALSVLYRYAPSRNPPRWQWVTWGSGIATALWLAVSALFTVYVSNVGSYGSAYGSIGAVVVMLMWMYLSALAVLLGAEVNSELEHQTARDSTVHGDQPMGERDAEVADHVGRRP